MWYSAENHHWIPAAISFAQAASQQQQASTNPVYEQPQAILLRVQGC
jgi:hypothetical protein